ncbi:MAG: hypothetical protein ABF893_17560 [Gluconacetobacter liquefaciens]
MNASGWVASLRSGVFEMAKIAASDRDQCVCENITDDGDRIVSIARLFDNRKSARTDRAGMRTVVSFGERAGFDSDYGGRLYQRRFNGGIEFLGHNQFLIESVNTSMMEAAGVADNGHSRLLGGAT